MLKLLGSGVLDGEQVEGLISHLNEREFLSAFGLHSMSKLDPAYDQIDIDNGGGGNYTAFTPQIIERLYKLGRADVAEDLLRRILWWGERMPYWGDSIVANNVDYRRDTPLQNTIGALAGAQRSSSACSASGWRRMGASPSTRSRLPSRRSSD